MFFCSLLFHNAALFRRRVPEHFKGSGTVVGSMMEQNLLVVDDCQVYLDLLCDYLARKSAFSSIASTRSGKEALELAQEFQSSIVVTDIPLRDLNGIDMIRELRKTDEEIRVAVVSSIASDALLDEAIQAGATAVFLKAEAQADELFRVLTRVLPAGETYVGPSAGILLNRELKRDGQPLFAFSAITPREREVVQLISQGMSSKEIANVLGVSVKTIDAHRQQLARKLCVGSVAELTRYAVREGLTRL